jgi:futalosine hydrolase
MLLLVAATSFELKPLLSDQHLNQGEISTFIAANGMEYAVLITGIGSVPTAFHLTKAIQTGKYSVVVNAGVAGTYNMALQNGDVVVVDSDTFADYGIDDNGNFRTLFQEGLANPNHAPFTKGVMNCNYNQNVMLHLTQLKRVSGITVSTASGSTQVIDRLENFYNPDIETMESAAVFYICLMTGTPFLCLRAISNRVEPRNRKSWDLPLAINSLCTEVNNLICKL